MLIYQKYILKNLFLTFFIIAGTLSGVTWMLQSIKYLDLIINKGAKITDFLLITIYLLPYILFTIMPITLYLTITYVFKKMILDKELIILCSFGIAKQKIIKVFIWFTFILILLQYLISIFAIPLSIRELKNIKTNIDKEALINLLVVNKFISPISGVTIYIGSKKPSNIIKCVFISDSRKPDKYISFIAQSGQFIKQNKDFILELNLGSILEYYPNKSKYLIKFSKYKIALNSLLSSANTKKKEPNEYSIQELLFSESFTKDNILRYRAYGHFRLLWPLLTLTVCVPTLILLSYGIQRRESLKLLDLLHLIIMLSNIILFMLFYILSYKSKIYPMFMYIIALIIPTVLIISLKSSRE